MSDKPKKIRIYKFAAQYNIPTEKIEELLRDKGFAEKAKITKMTIITDEMMAVIEEKFKKEIDAARKHYRKIEDFKKKISTKEEREELERKQREKEAEEAAKKKEEKEAEEKPAESATADEKADETPVQKETEEVKEEAETVEETAEAESKESAESEKEEQAEEVKEAEKAEEEKPKEKFVTETEKALEDSGGLKVLGKIELEDKKKKKKKRSRKKAKAEDEKKSKKEEKEATSESVTPAQPVETPVAEETGSKKKKKKLKAKKRKKGGEGEEEKAGKRKKKSKKFEIDKREVEIAIKKTLLEGDDTQLTERAQLRKKKKKEKQQKQEEILEQLEREKSVLKVTEFISVGDLAALMHVNANEVIAKLFGMGLMVTINQRLDFETIQLVADEFGYEVELQEELVTDALEDTEDPPESLVPRPPVVTIMGHVDHGKTSLLDYIRRTNVVAGESGGITQHIGAYHVEVESGGEKKYITFLDTPGHEAFTAMRARGAQVTDIVVLIVAADDAVMPQTVEAINHAQSAGVPIIVAINKVDKPNANPEKIKQQLAERNVLIEEWGGKYQSVEISAKQGTNVDVLLEKILLEAEMLELKANPNRKARGTIIESKLDKGRGVVATVLVQKGTLHVGEPFVAGIYSGRVRSMTDERGKKIKEAGPSIPVVITGFEGVPQAGDQFVVVESEKQAHEIASKRQQIKREQDQRKIQMHTLDEIARRIGEGEVRELPIIIKGDVDGSVEALADSFLKLSTEDVKVNIVHKGVGAITESDVLLAAAAKAIIIGFHVRPHLNARKLAETEKIEIRLYNVIYDAIEEVKSALEGMLKPIISEEVTGTLEVRETFKVPKVGTVAGCYVVDGKITRQDKVRLFRDGVKIYEGELASLKRFKDDVKEVVAGYECGLGIANFNDIKVGDTIEAFQLVETKRKLD